MLAVKKYGSLLKRFCCYLEASMRKSLWIVLALILALSICAVAQNISGEIRGVISDQSGAVVSGATVTATDDSTNLQRTTQTSGSGVYAITDLPPGKYRV